VICAETSYSWHPDATAGNNYLRQPSAAALLKAKTPENQNRFAIGFAGLAKRVAAKFAPYGSERWDSLYSYGLEYLGRRYQRMEPSCQFIAAYLQKCLERELMRGNIALARGLDLPNRVRVARHTDAAIHFQDGRSESLDELIGRLCRNAAGLRKYDPLIDAGFETPEDVRFACIDDCDWGLVELRYDGGAGPRCLTWVAKQLGITHYDASRRLDAIERRVHAVRGTPVPRVKRTRGI
jgi:hypothetical protein